jgi:hypothetical protein
MERKSRTPGPENVKRKILETSTLKAMWALQEHRQSPARTAKLHHQVKPIPDAVQQTMLIESQCMHHRTL